MSVGDDKVSATDLPASRALSWRQSIEKLKLTNNNKQLHSER